jgi:hypothetical protein
MIRLSFNISTISEILILLFYLVFVYPLGFAFSYDPTRWESRYCRSASGGIPHLHRYQAVFHAMFAIFGRAFLNILVFFNQSATPVKCTLASIKYATL